MNKNAFFKYVETRAQNAYGSALLVKFGSATKYSLLIASETVPAVFGSQGSFEFNLVNAKTMGKVSDKTTLDDKEVEFLLHRDNIYRLEQLNGEICDFLYLTPDFMGWKFAGTISARPNDATADVLRGTYTITPISADPTPIYDCRSLIQETVTITNSIDDSIQVSNGANGTSITVECDVGGFGIAVKLVDGYGNEIASSGAKFTATPTAPTGTSKEGTVTFKGVNSTTNDYAIALITVSKSDYASWTTTVALQGGAT